MDGLSISTVLLDVIEAWNEAAEMWHVMSVLVRQLFLGEILFNLHPFLSICDTKYLI